jgi:hypothetical protein
MWHLSWEAFRAYISPIVVTILALLGLWKDANDYRDLVKSDPSEQGFKHFARKNIVGILCILTILVSLLGIFDIHAARVASREAETEAKIEKRASDALIKSLEQQIGGLRQDGITNAKTFSESFSNLNDKFSDLQAKVRNQDLLDQLASTKTELQATQKQLEPKPRAVIESSFINQGPTTIPQTPVRMTEAKVANGVVTVFLTLFNSSDVDGLNGALKVVICDSCKFAEEPTLFQHLPDDPSQLREYDFQHVFHKSKVSAMTLKISVPDAVPNVLIRTVVICETCDHTRVETFLIKLIR